MNIAACEALATKAELQELRQQITQLLGKPETEGDAPVDVLQSGTLVGTTIGAGLVYGLDIVEDVGGKYVTLVKKNLEGIEKGFEGTKKFLTKTRNMVQANFGMVKDLAKGRIGLMLDVANLAATLAMAIETLELEKRLGKAEAQLLQSNIDYGSLKAVLRKTEGDLLAAIGVIDVLQDNLQTSIANNQVLKQDVNKQKESIVKLEDSLAIQTENIETLEQTLEDYQEYAEDEIAELTDYIGQLKDRFDKHAKSYGELGIYVAKTEIKLTDLDKTSDEIQEKITTLSFTQTFQHTEIGKLYQDLQTQTIVNQSQEIRLIEALKKAEENGGIGSSYNTNSAIADQQKATLGLASALLGNPPAVKDEEQVGTTPISEGLNAQTVLDGSTDFAKEFNKLIANIPDITNLGENVTPQQMEQILADFGANIKDGINTNTEAAVAGTIAALVTPTLGTIVTQTSPASISSAVGSEICNQTANPDSCLNKGIGDPMNKGFKDIKDGLGLGLDAGSLALDASILGKIIIMQKFLDKAWNSTLVDKTLNAANTALAFHNAIMLSRNLGQTIGDTSTSLLQLMNVKSHEGEAIDVNEWVSAKIKGVAQTILGAETYATLTTGINAANRILTAAQGMIGALNGVKDALQEGQQLIVNRVGTLGNAFLEQGIFEDDAYPWMSDKVNLKTPFSKVTAKVQALTEFVEEVNQLVQTGIEVQENIGEFSENLESASEGSEELVKALEDYAKEKQDKEDEKEIESESPEIENKDLIEDEE